VKFKFKIMGTIEQASATCRCVLLFFIFATCSQASIPNFAQADFAYSGDRRVEVTRNGTETGPDLSGSLGGAGGISGILADFRPQTSDLRYFHADAMGNVVLTTDSSGDITSTHRYTPFGRPITSTGSYQPRFGYSSKEYDHETGLNNFGYRYLVVSQGRWLNRDPLGEVGGINLYGFVMNRPLIGIDPLGLEVKEFIGQARLFGLLSVPDNHMPYYYGTTFLDEGRAQVQNAASLFYNVIYGGLEAVTLPFAMAEEAAGADLDALYMSAYGSGFMPAMLAGAVPHATMRLAVTGNRSLSNLRRIKCLPAPKKTFNPSDYADDVARIRAESAARHGLTDASEGVVAMARKSDIKAIDNIVRSHKLTKGQRRLLHDEITGQNLPLKEIDEIAKQIKRGFPNK